MLITKKEILNALPAFRSELEQHMPTKRHLDRFDQIIFNLEKKGIVKVMRLDNTVHYSKAPALAEVA